LFSMLYVYIRQYYLKSAVVFVSSVATLFFTVELGIGISWSGTERYLIGGWGAPLGIDLFVDGVSSAMLILTAAIGSCITIYALGYFSDDNEEDASEFFWPLWFFLWGGLNALFLSADIFNIYVTLELVTFSAVALITLASSRSALVAASRYLFVTLLGSMGYLLGVGLLYSSYGTLDIVSLSDIIRPDPMTISAVSLIITGLLIKSALFPLHFWLPAAHGSAPSPVSAALSGLVVTAPVYLMIRFWFLLFNFDLTYIANLFGILGTMAILWGSFQALFQKRLKMLIAYSTVGQMGYIFLMFPLASGDSLSQAFAWNGGIVFALSHGCSKAAAFMAAGSIIKELGHDRIKDFNGLARISPMNVFVLGLAGISLMGLPPSGGFIAKWFLLKAAMHSGQWWYAVIILLGGLITAAYIFKVLEICLSEAEEEIVPATYTQLHYAALLIALVSVFLGLGTNLLITLLEVGQPQAIEHLKALAL
ncbi:MAG: proton-conducting transporter membrane subunit, partial [Waddliaceae bacterium]